MDTAKKASLESVSKASDMGKRLIARVVRGALFLGFVVAGCGCLHAGADDLKPRVIVFVHGIHVGRDTWRASNGAYWPQLIQTDPHFRESDVVVAEYPTPSMRGQLSTEKLSQLLWQRLKAQRVWEHREVVFVAHSLGGILTE